MQVKVENLIAVPFVSSLSFFNDKELHGLFGTSKQFNAAATEELYRRSLLKHIVLGEQKEAEALIKSHPKWLLSKSQAQDYSGKRIIATPFQAAIGAGDKPMWEMILRYLDPNRALKQFLAWFPNGIEEDTPAIELQKDYNRIALAIIHDADGGASAIAGFREQLTAQKEIRYGKYFNLEHLKAASQAYTNNFRALGNWNNRDLFWIQVMGFVQRQMTAYDAQVYFFGVQKVLDNEVSFSRLPKLSKDEELFLPAVYSGLGYDFALFSFYEDGRSVGMRRTAPSDYGYGKQLAEKLCRIKADALAGLRQSLEQGMCCQP